jgi:hypothetical protein
MADEALMAPESSLRSRAAVDVADRGGRPGLFAHDTVVRDRTGAYRELDALELVGISG